MKIFRAKENFLYIFVSISFLYGILSFQHYSPSFHDFYIHAFVFLFLNIGLFVYFFNKELKIYLNQFLYSAKVQMGWLALQPGSFHAQQL